MQSDSAALLHYYRTPGLLPSQQGKIKEKLALAAGDAHRIVSFETEYCFNVQTAHALDEQQQRVLRWLLRETFEPQNFGSTSFLKGEGSHVYTFEIGPRLSFATAWSTNAVAICHASGLTSIQRVERSRRIQFAVDKELSQEQIQRFVASIHDKMTECVYAEPLQSFETNIKPEGWTVIRIMEEGRAALEKVNKEMGLALDDWDLDYYTKLFTEEMKRNPTSVEAFDISQSNSEHSRHWFFKGRLVIDGQEVEESLMDLVIRTLEANPNNSLIAFRDNSSTMKGYPIKALLPSKPGEPGPMEVKAVDYDVLLTAETHNFPTGVAPFPGAETGTGGRIRDTHATGRGSLVVAGTAGYCVGNLNIPDYPLAWEDQYKDWKYPAKFASPLQIELEASNGASDYGNKFGEPLIAGFTRSFGMRLPNGERREFMKPIMFTGGLGQMDHKHVEKAKPEKGMLVVKLGGPAYRIGVGGGAASSMVQGTNAEELDFQAVQRGDAEMGQKVNRVIRTCVELGDRNPIVSIHDQGAGGNGNVLKEIVEPEGARIEIRSIHLGDHTLSVMEIWGAEYQENDALLLKKEDAPLFDSICHREDCPYAVVGVVSGDGHLILHDEKDDTVPLDLDLDAFLAKMPRKTFVSDRLKFEHTPFVLPSSLDATNPQAVVSGVLSRVLRLLSVGSKRFLTTKVDRSVTGLIAQQQCVGPLHIPLADYAVVAQSYEGLTGGVTAIGEQPIKGLTHPQAMARMSVGEMLTNIVWAKLSGLGDIKCSGNWMWAAKLPHEGAALYDACKAMSEMMIQLGIAIDGGKDSLSMAALAGGETVKAPGTLVVSGYCTTPDFSKKVTPDLKGPLAGIPSTLLLIDLGANKNRIGGSALGQVYNQLGGEVPDVDDVDQLKKAFLAVQELLDQRKVLAGHDRSDGGLITTLLEMAYAGNCGISVTLNSEQYEGEELAMTIVRTLFAEELGLVLEVRADHADEVVSFLHGQGLRHVITLGTTTRDDRIKLTSNGHLIIDQPMTQLRNVWEETSFQLDKRQANPKCVEEERTGLASRQAPDYRLTFEPRPTPSAWFASQKPRVAVLREEGSNGDREMAGAFNAAGFEAWDVKMKDLLEDKVSLSQFRGIAFVGGFSYADVMDSGKGWAGLIHFNKKLLEEFQAFYRRKDTFSLGICNGCQLMALLGAIPFPKYYEQTTLEADGASDAEEAWFQSQPRFIHNESERFESRFVTLKIMEDNPSIFLKGMEGSSLGCWSSHGEGKVHFPSKAIEEQVLQQHLAPIRYVDDHNRPTETYPFNPNGSMQGIAALCSPDGRHMAIMPHPERTFLRWQWAWMPHEWKEETVPVSPWLHLFQNARRWCDDTTATQQ